MQRRNDEILTDDIMSTLRDTTLGQANIAQWEQGKCTRGGPPTCINWQCGKKWNVNFSLLLPKLINLYLSLIFQIGRGQFWPLKIPLCIVFLKMFFVFCYLIRLKPKYLLTLDVYFYTINLDHRVKYLTFKINIVLNEVVSV